MNLELGDRRGVAESLEGYANVALVSGRPLRADSIWGAEERLRSEIGSPMLSGQRPSHESRVRAARAAFGNVTTFEALSRKGSAMTMEQAVAYAEQSDLD